MKREEIAQSIYVESARMHVRSGDPHKAIELIDHALKLLKDKRGKDDLRKDLQRARDEAELGTLEKAEHWLDSAAQSFAPESTLPPFRAERSIDGKGGRTNGERATMASVIITMYAKPSTELSEPLSDLLSDLMHLCHRQRKPANFFRTVVDKAENRFREET